MTPAFAQALFYDSALAFADLQYVVLGAVEQPAIDTIEFADEAGGDLQRELALPYLPGMDAVIIDAASLAFRVGDRQVETTAYSVSPGPGGCGLVLKLNSPARLRRLDLTYTVAPELIPGGQTAHLIVRPVQDSGFGPPILAAPPFNPPGLTYGKTLDGMTVAIAPGDRHVATLPGLLGSSWLLQIATATSEPAELVPQQVAPTVNRVVIDAAPRNLSIVLSGPPDVPLWGNKEALLPEAGEQTVSFLPLAQKRMTDSLAAAQPGWLTLPLSLRFHADTAARLEVTSRTLSGHYTVRPFGAAPATLRLGGRAAALVVAVPAGLHPANATLTLVARPLGRTLNAASPSAPLDLRGHGVRVDTGRSVAARVAVAPRVADPAGSAVPLASIALRLLASEAAEVVLELRLDGAGRPGAIAGKSVVRQLAAGFDDWLEFELATALPANAGSAVWASLRLTKGSVLWHGASDATDFGAAYVSIDKGASWGAASTALFDAASLLVQAFHVQDPPIPSPVIRVQSGFSLLAADLFAGAVSSGKAFQRNAAALPQPVLDLFAASPAPAGQPRAATTLLLVSDTVLDLVASDLVISYDPATAKGTP